MGKDLSGKEIGKCLTQRRDGLYQARFTSSYKDQDGKPIRRQKSFRYIEDAKEWLATEMYEDRYCGLGANMTVKALFKVWMDHNKDSIKESTANSYESVWRNQVERLLGDYRVKDVKMMHIQSAINTLHDRGYSEKTIRNTRMMIGTMFRYAEANDMILKNPVNSMVTVPKDHRENDKLKALTQEQADDLIERLPEGRYRDMAILILNTGLRIGEVCGLMWKDIDFNARELNVRRTAWRSRKEGKQVLGEPKTKKSVRTIPLTDEAMTALRDAKSRRRHLRTNVVTIEYAELVFPSDNGGILDRSGFDQVLKQYCKFSGLPSFSAHTLRHTFATRCVEAGVDYKTIQDFMGHSSLRITMDTYVHVDRESKKKGIEKLEKTMRRIG